MTTLNKIGLLIFVMGAPNFPVPDSDGALSVFVNAAMVFGGAVMFLWGTPK
jgi:hypothetical protein